MQLQVTTPPEAPTSISAVAGDGQATVSWTAPSADGGSAITGYTVTSSPGAQNAAVGASTLNTAVTGLTNGASYTFTVTAANAIGTSASSTPSNVVTPNSAAPAITAAADVTTNEGATLNMVVITFTDTEPSDTHTATIDWGDGGGTDAGAVSESSGSGSVTGVHAYADNGSYIVTVTVIDSSAGVASGTLIVTVNNVAPVVNVGPNQTVGAGAFQLTQPTFTDQGAADTHTVTIDWGDGTTENKTAIAGSHQYDAVGTYTLIFSVTDDDGGVGTGSMQLQVTSAPATVNIPSVEAWGLLALGAVLMILVVRTARRRQSGHAWRSEL